MKCKKVSFDVSSQKTDVKYMVGIKSAFFIQEINASFSIGYFLCAYTYFISNGWF